MRDDEVLASLDSKDGGPEAIRPGREVAFSQDSIHASLFWLDPRESDDGQTVYDRRPDSPRVLADPTGEDECVQSVEGDRLRRFPPPRGQ